MGDHAESIQLDFDPTVISYETLLAEFWKSHSPFSKPWSRQYMSAIFPADADQERLAKASAEALARARGKTVHTEIARLGTFTRAEDYHQKYSLRADRALMAILKDVTDSERAFTDSTLAMLLNAWRSGDLSDRKLHQRLAGLTLPEALRTRLLDALPPAPEPARSGS